MCSGLALHLVYLHISRKWWLRLGSLAKSKESNYPQKRHALPDSFGFEFLSKHSKSMLFEGTLFKVGSKEGESTASWFSGLKHHTTEVPTPKNKATPPTWEYDSPS